MDEKIREALQQAYTGEAKAALRLKLFADTADTEGYKQIARLLAFAGTVSRGIERDREGFHRLLDGKWQVVAAVGSFAGLGDALDLAGRRGVGNDGTTGRVDPAIGLGRGADAG